MLKFFKKLFKKKYTGKIHNRGPKTDKKLYSSLEKNEQALKDAFKDCGDVVYKKFSFGREGSFKGLLVYLDGMIDKNVVNQEILKSLIYYFSNIQDEKGILSQKSLDDVVQEGITASEIKKTDKMKELVNGVLCGDTIVVVDGLKQGIMVGTKGWDYRSVQEPTNEAAVRGSREGFTENLRTNTTLVRRRLRDNELKLKMYKIGGRTNTNIAMMYLADLANPSIVDEVDKRLRNIHKGGIQESGELEQMIEDDWLSPFPQMKYTERPDVVVSSLLEGQVAVFTDTTPFALIMPISFISLLHSPEDYYERWYISSFIRLLRFGAFLTALILPALYVAIVGFHPGMLPTPLALSIAATREGVPFSSLVEALIMTVSLELLREAGLRLPAPIGQTVGIVGGLIIGEAAVRAGIVSPIMVIIVALTAISSFATPTYSLAAGIRVLTFMMLVISAFLGLYGLVLGLIGLVVHLVTLKSFGSHYLSPFISTRFVELLDTFIRSPFPSLRYRPGVARPQDFKRQRDIRQDDIINREESDN